MSLQKVKIRKKQGEPVLIVPCECSFSQVIITLCRNNSEWLTSLGWYPSEKNIPLNCHSVSDGIAIRIPERHVHTLVDGDSLNIQCPELRFEGDVIWETDAAATQSSPTQSSLTKGAMAQPKETQAIGVVANNPASQKKILALAAGLVAVFIVAGGAFFLRGSDQAKPDKIVKAPEADVSESVSSEDLSPKIGEAGETAEAESPKPDSAPKPKVEDVITKPKVTPKIKETPSVATPPVEPSVETTQTVPTSSAPLNVVVPDAQQPQARPFVPSPTVDRFDTVSINSELQTRLRNMDYYAGPINGQRNIDTLKSVSVFKSTYNIPASAKIDDRFMSRLRFEEGRYVQEKARALREAEARIAAERLRNSTRPPTPAPVISAPVVNVVPESIPQTPTNSIAPAPVIIPQTPNVETKPLEAKPVETDTARPVKPVEVVPAALVKEAALPKPEAEPKPESEIDTKANAEAPNTPATDGEGADIIKAKLVKRAVLNYPKRLSAGKFDKVVTMRVGFDVTEAGEVVNIEIQDSSYEGSFYKYFEKEAIKSAKSQKFSPKQINNEAVISKGHTMTVKFD